MNTTSGNGNSLVQAIMTSWLAWTALIIFVVLMLGGGNAGVARASLIIAAVLAMNGLAKSDLWFTSRGPGWWKEHRWLSIFHHVTNEGEMAGILVGVITLAILYRTGVHVHFPLAEAFALLGIMSAARIAVRHVAPILALLERVGGVWLVVGGGSLIASLSGEPAAAVFLSDYLRSRVHDEDRVKVATGLAATIGSGGGLLPFAAPPILIIWGTLSEKFGWGIPQLIGLVGAGCVGHIVFSMFYFKKYIMLSQSHEGEKFEAKGAGALVLLGTMVILHIVSSGPWLWGLDAAVGVANWWLAQKQYASCAEDEREVRFAAKWQPLILALLLIALDVIGTAVDPLIGSIAQLLPTSIPPVILAFILFLVTGWISHFADNALASRAFIMVPVAMIPVVGRDAAQLLAVAVVSGALFGGFLTVPANLPNFPIRRAFDVSPGAWFRRALVMYPTGLAYLVWLAALSLLLRWL